MRPRHNVLLIGSPRDATFRHTVDVFTREGLQFVILNVDRFCKSGNLEGTLSDPDSIVACSGETRTTLGGFSACYCRFVELPVGWEIEHAGAVGRFRMLQLALVASDLLLVNRPGAGESNDSKPSQTSLLERHGFRVPRSCATNHELTAASFVESCRTGAIYKSNSGERSIVQLVEPADVGRFPALAACPVFFQERIVGDDIRIHVVRDRCHGVLIRSEATDYRYDETGDATSEPFNVPSELARRCVRVTHALGLEFSGIDFKRSDDDGEYYCFEVNPMPGYHGYDLALDYQISASLAELLFTTAG